MIEVTIWIIRKNIQVKFFLKQQAWWFTKKNGMKISQEAHSELKCVPFKKKR
jgi:hypothetical protein